VIARTDAWRRLATGLVRRCIVGRGQRWEFQAPLPGWVPPPVDRTSLYLHVPFCRHACPYCPYTKFPHNDALVGAYTRAAAAEVDWWARAVGSCEVTSVYVGGGTPTLALDSVDAVLDQARLRFRLTGDIAIETNPADIDAASVARLHDMGVGLVSLGVQSFQAANLRSIGRAYGPAVAERALALLASRGFASVNVDLMFALPGQTTAGLLADLDRAAQLGASQITAYPLFTFPYTSVGAYLNLKAVRLPDWRTRRAQYRAICAWSAANGFDRVSVWGFRKGTAPRYSSVTRAGYIGIGPGAGSHLPDGFAFNTFDLETWTSAATNGAGAVALRMPFSRAFAGWWWLYWRLYDTRIPLDQMDVALGPDAPRVRRWLRVGERAGLATRHDGAVTLTDRGAFWLHLTQNYLALDCVNTVWTAARRQPWPAAVVL
jgi:oxygen-independent coproporphyrinogen III oxidase